jgi:hypothetical protein
MIVRNKIFTFILLGFIISSSVGISFYLHECGCRHKTLFDLKAGYSEAGTFCCCSSEPIRSNNSPSDNNVKDESCCKDKYFFLLVPFGPEKEKVNVPFFQFKIIEFSAIYFFIDDEAPEINGNFLTIHSPPGRFSGKDLVLFLQQVKIPFSIA